MRENPTTHFFKNVKKTSTCWLWTAAKTWDGYGIVWKDSKNTYAHRFSYEFHKGIIPMGAYVLHTCDNPPCVNPDHLYLGTPKQNARDALNKDRNTRGETHGMSKLNDDQIRWIRKTYTGSPSDCSKMAKALGVCRDTVSLVVHRKTWKHISP